VFADTDFDEESIPMTDDSMALLALIQKSDNGDFLKTVAETALQRIMD
jgi:hypothetical protein